MNYFTTEDRKDLESLKKAFKKRCLELHPDKGGDVEKFKKMHVEFKQIMDSADIDFTVNARCFDESASITTPDWSEFLKKAGFKTHNFRHKTEPSKDREDALKYGTWKTDDEWKADDDKT